MAKENPTEDMRSMAYTKDAFAALSHQRATDFSSKTLQAFVSSLEEVAKSIEDSTKESDKKAHKRLSDVIEATSKTSENMKRLGAALRSTDLINVSGSYRVLRELSASQKGAVTAILRDNKDLFQSKNMETMIKRSERYMSTLNKTLTAVELNKKGEVPKGLRFTKQELSHILPASLDKGGSFRIGKDGKPIIDKLEGLIDIYRKSKGEELAINREIAKHSNPKPDRRGAEIVNKFLKEAILEGKLDDRGSFILPELPDFVTPIPIPPIKPEPDKEEDKWGDHVLIDPSMVEYTKATADFAKLSKLLHSILHERINKGDLFPMIASEIMHLRPKVEIDRTSEDDDSEESVVDAVKEIGDSVSKEAHKGLALIGKGVMQILKGFFDKSASEVESLMDGYSTDPFKTFLDQMEKYMNAVFDGLKSIVTGAVGVIGAVVGATEEGEGQVASQLTSVMGVMLGAVIQAYQIVGNAILGVIKFIYKKLAESSPILQGFLKMFQTAVNLIFLPIGNIMGGFFMMFGIHMINFAVWWNQEFPKYKYAIIGYMLKGTSLIIRFFSMFSGAVASILRMVGAVVGLYPGGSVIQKILYGAADAIMETKGPIDKLAHELFKAGDAALELHNILAKGPEHIKDFDEVLAEHEEKFSTSLSNIDTTMGELINALQESVDKTMGEQKEGWYDRQMTRGDGSFWKGLGKGALEMSSPITQFYVGKAGGLLGEALELTDKILSPSPISKGLSSLVQHKVIQPLADGIDYLADGVGGLAVGVGGWLERNIFKRNAAHGAYIPASPGGTIVRVGEGTRDEIITPVGRGTSSGGYTINVTIQGNIYGERHLKKVITDTIKDEMNRWNVS